MWEDREAERLRQRDSAARRWEDMMAMLTNSDKKAKKRALNKNRNKTFSMKGMEVQAQPSMSMGAINDYMLLRKLLDNGHRFDRAELEAQLESITPAMLVESLVEGEDGEEDGDGIAVGKGKK